MTIEELKEYEKACGSEAAANLLLLAGPDNFEGDFDETMARLEGKRNEEEHNG